MSGNGKIAMQNDKKRRFLSIGTVVVAVLLIIALIFLFFQLRIGRSLSSSVSLSLNPENYGEVVTHKIRTLTQDDKGAPGFITYGTTTGEDGGAVETGADTE